MACAKAVRRNVRTFYIIPHFFLRRKFKISFEEQPNLPVTLRKTKEKAAKTMAPRSSSKRKAAPAAAEVIPVVDWSKMTVAQLKSECTQRGLPTDGKKVELVARLEGQGYIV